MTIYCLAQLQLLDEIRPVLYRKVKFCIIAMIYIKTDTQNMSVLRKLWRAVFDRNYDRNYVRNYDRNCDRSGEYILLMTDIFSTSIVITYVIMIVITNVVENVM